MGQVSRSLYETVKRGPSRGLILLNQVRGLPPGPWQRPRNLDPGAGAALGPSDLGDLRGPKVPTPLQSSSLLLQDAKGPRSRWQ